MVNRATCRTCGAAIVWLKHDRTDKPAPIDSEPVPDGPVVMIGHGKYAMWQEGDDRARYTNHFQTCPQSAFWKSDKRPVQRGLFGEG